MGAGARRTAFVLVCVAWSLAAAGCVKIGGSAEPSPTPITLPTLPTVSGSASPTPGTPLTDDQLLSASQNSIVRIETTDCDHAYQTGSGYFVAPGLVVTAFHVVKKQQTVAVRTLSTRAAGEHVFSGEIIGHNDAADVALIRVGDDATQVLTTATADPTATMQIASIGYPKGLPIDLETGRITGVDQDIVVTEGQDRRALTGALRFSAPAAGGNSGGPLLDRTGAVVGLVDSGFADGSQVHFAVPGKTVKALADGWAASPELETPPDCDDASSSPSPNLRIKSPQPDAPGIALAVAAYVDGINAGDQVVDAKTQLTGYELAYQQLSGSRLTTYPTLEKFSNTHHQRISNVVLSSVDYVDDTDDTARVAYDVVTFGADGTQTGCARRTLDYTMSIATGVWTFSDEEVRKRGAC